MHIMHYPVQQLGHAYVQGSGKRQQFWLHILPEAINNSIYWQYGQQNKNTDTKNTALEISLSVCFIMSHVFHIVIYSMIDHVNRKTGNKNM